MFTTPTVFVLGAGISAPFGFPVGRQMKDAICNGGYLDSRGNRIATLGPDHMAELIAAAMSNPDSSVAKRFIDGFRASDLYSIDAWLETNQADDFMLRAGKCAIAAVLMHDECQAVNGGADVNEDWFSWLWNNMWTPEIAGIADNQVQFITFNYDRLFEWKLERQVKNSYLRATPEEHEKAIKNLKKRIHHVHGVLNADKETGEPNLSRFGNHDLRSLIAGSPTETASKRATFGNQVRLHARTINIVCENQGDDKVVNTAQSIILRCIRQKESRLVFLGFSFDERNIIKLNLDRFVLDLEDEKIVDLQDGLDRGKVIGSARGLLRGERTTVAEMLNKKIALGLDNTGAMDFCRSYLRSPSARMTARRKDD